MKKFVILFMLAVCTLQVTAQNKYAESINEAAADMELAMKSKNYQTLVKYTYPKVVEMVGGEENLLDLVKNSMEAVEAQGLLFKDIIIGEPQKLYTAGTELHCLVPQTVTMENSESIITSETFLLAVSTNEGKNWYFLDTAMLNEQYKASLFPNFNNQLQIPVPTQPVFTPKQ